MTGGSTMCTRLRAVILVFVATALLAASAMQRATAQPAQPDDSLLKASKTPEYARYYAPYAIQAAAAYLGIDALDALKNKVDQNGYGVDTQYVVDQTIDGDITKSHAH